MESSPQRKKQGAETPWFPLRPLAWSLALHLLVLGALAPRYPDDAGGSAAQPLRAQLRQPPEILPAKPLPVAVPPAPTFREPRRQHAEPEPQPVVASPNGMAAAPGIAEPASGPVAAAREYAAASQPATPQPAATSGTVVLVEPKVIHGPDAAGLRQFRLALAGEARRFRRYPEAARRAGLAGTAEVRVLVEAGSASRRAELARSSGQAVLDKAALDMLHQAAARAVLPESLRGQSFTVLLPVVFEVEE